MVPGQQQAKQLPAPGAPEGTIYLDPQMSGQLRKAYDKLLGQGYSPEMALKMAEQALMQGIRLLEQLPNAPATPEAPPPPSRSA